MSTGRSRSSTASSQLLKCPMLLTSKSNRKRTAYTEMAMTCFFLWFAADCSIIVSFLLLTVGHGTRGVAVLLYQEVCRNLRIMRRILGSKASLPLVGELVYHVIFMRHSVAPH